MLNAHIQLLTGVLGVFDESMSLADITNDLQSSNPNYDVVVNVEVCQGC